MIGSFDEGPQQGYDFDEAKAELKVEMASRGVSFVALCSRAGLDHLSARRSLEKGTEGFPESMVVLERLTAALATFPKAREANLSDAVWTAVKKLLWKYCYKAEKSLEEGRRFEDFLLVRFGNQVVAGAAERFRDDPPVDLVQMSFWYERFRRENRNGNSR